MLNRIAKFASGLAMSVLLLLGIAKLVDLPAFADALRTWNAIPEWAVAPLCIAVPVFEVLIALSWILGMCRRWAIAIAFCFLMIVTLAYLGQRFLSDPPRCGCAGVVSRYWSEIDSTVVVVTRNALMLIAFGVQLRVAREHIRLNRVSATLSTQPSNRRGFTLIEALVVVALVGLLIGLLAPSIGGVRDKARVANTLANLRSHASIFTVYAGDFRDTMPAATYPTGLSIIRCPSQDIAVKAKYFDMARLWQIALADGYYNGDPSSMSFRSPLNPYSKGIGRLIETDYWYACSFLASPEFYNDTTRALLPQQLRAVHLGEVVFPDSKSVLAEYALSWGPPGAAWAAFTDGHADESTVVAELTHKSGDGAKSYDYNGHFPAARYPLLHTENGVRGRDK
ncbi:MAG: prepilin-type N-terminal cleavage/methylation domain-containing protein [Phycisphaerae bacterium]|nr:prepilin-type N-terminal cleavage/methylation domain-containing protein [Phycisphaerae bacterium]